MIARLLFVGALLLAPLSVAAERPAVVIGFDLAGASIFDQRFPEEGKSILRKKVIDQVVTEAERQRPLVRWTAESAGPPAAAILTVRLVQKEGPNQLTSIKLVWQKKVGNLPPSDIVQLDHPLYGFWDIKPNSADELAAKVVEVVTEQFRDQDFVKNLTEYFLKSIPLAGKIYTDSAMEQIVVPLPKDETRIGPESELRVDFESHLPTNGELASGFMYLGGATYSRNKEEGWEGYLACGITKFSFGPIRFNDGWRSEIPSILSQPPLEGVTVYLKEYQWDPTEGTINGDVVTPR
jgi:hypothetical protein